MTLYVVCVASWLIQYGSVFLVSCLLELHKKELGSYESVTNSMKDWEGTLIMCSWTQVHSWLPSMESNSSSEIKKKRGNAFLFESR